MKTIYKINAMTLIIAFVIVLTNPIVSTKVENDDDARQFIVRDNPDFIKKSEPANQELVKYEPIKINYLSSNILNQDSIKTEPDKEIPVYININNNTSNNTKEESDTVNKTDEVQVVEKEDEVVKDKVTETNKETTTKSNNVKVETTKKEDTVNKTNTSKNNKVESNKTTTEKNKVQVSNKTNTSKNNKVESNKTTTNKKISYTKNEAYELAKIIMCEAEGEPQKCKEYVGQVVLNRVKSDRFPNTIHGVIFQKNQFTPTSNGRWNKKEPNQDCWDAAYKVLNASEPLTDALFFEACKGSSWHSRNLTKVAHIGRTRFYKY